MADISIPEGDNPVRYQASLGGNQKYRNMGNVSGQAYLVRGQVTNVYYQKGTLDFNTYGSSVTSGVTDGSGSAPIPVDFWGKNTDGKVFGCYRPVQKGSQILVAYIGGDTSRPIVIGVYPDNEASYELISPVHYNTGDDSTDDVQNDALGERKIYPNQQMMYESGKGDILRSMGGKSFLYISENGSGYLDDINYAYDEIRDFYDDDVNEIEPTMTKAQSWLLVHEDNDSDEASDGHRTRFYVNRSGELMVTFANKDDPNNIVVLEASKDSGFKLTKRFDNSNIKEDSEDYVQFGIGNGNNVSIKSVDSGDATSFYLDNGNIKFNTPKEGSITFDGLSVDGLLGKVSNAENVAKDASDKADIAATAGEHARSAASDAARQALAASYAGEDAKSAAVEAQAAGEDAKAQAKDTRDRIIYYSSISNEKDVAIPGKYIIINTDTYIRDGTIKTAHIGDAAITNAKIADLAVGNAQIEDAAITRAKIGYLAVGTAQIEDAAITDAKVGTLSADHLNAGTIDFSVISGTHINASEIDVGKIVADQIFVNGLGDISKNLGTVTSGKITGTNINDDVNNVQSDVDNLNDPNLMSVIEKQTEAKQYAGLTSQYNVILARAKDDSISTTDLTTAYNNLNNLMSKLLADTTKASNIDRYAYNSLTYAYNMALSKVQTALSNSFNADIDNMWSNVSVASQAASSAVIVASQASITGDNANQVASRAIVAANDAQSAGNNAISVANNASQAASDAIISGSTAASNADKAITAASQAKSAGDNAIVVANNASQAASGAVIAGSTATINANKAIEVANQAKSAGDNATSAANNASQAASGAILAGSQASAEISSNSTATAKAQSTADSALANANSAVTKAESTASALGPVKKNADSALSAASSAVAKAESTASAFGPVKQNADSALSAALNAQNDASSAVTQASSATSDSKDAKQIAGAVSQSYKTLTDGSTMTIAELQSGLAAKLTKTDLNGYAKQDWTQAQIKLTSDGINGTISSIKGTVDSQTTSINDLKADSNGFKDQFTTVNNTLGTHTTDIGTLQSSSRELTSGFNTLTTDNNTNKNDISQLKQTATEVSSTLETVQTQVQNSAVGTNLIVQSDLKPSYLNRDTGGVTVSNHDFNSDNYIATNGETVFTFSSPDYVFKGSSNHTLAMYDSDKNYLGYQLITSATQTLSKPNAAYIRFSINFTDEGGTSGNLSDWLDNNRYKLEKGSIATDYSVSPEDTATVTAVSKISQTVDGMTTDISKKIEQKDLNGYATETWTNGQIKLTSDSIGEVLSKKIEQKDLNGYATQDWSQNQIKMTADGINGTISSIRGTVDGHTTSINTLQTDSNGFKDQFMKVNDTLGKHTTDIGTLQASSKSLSANFDSLSSDNKTNQHDIGQLQVSAKEFNNTLTTVQTQVQDSSVGINLAIGTNQEYAMGYGIPNTSWTDGYAYLKLPITSAGEILPQDPHTFAYTLIQGTTYTQTIWFETDATVKDLSSAQVTWFTNAHDYQPAMVQKLGQNSYKLVSTYTWPSKSSNNVRLFDIEHLGKAFDLSTGTYLKFGKLKLEKGSLATDWCLNPAETATQSQFTQLSDDINLRVEKGDLVDQINIQAGNTLISSSGQLTLSGKSVFLDSVDPVIMKSANIADLAVGTAQIADAAINSAKIAKLAVGTAQIGDGAITNAKIGKLAVGTAQIANGAITDAQIGNEAVGTAQIKDAAINSAKIAKLAVGTAQIGDGAITNAKIGKLAVGTAQIANGAITNAQIGSLAVGTANIKDAAITSAQIASLAVGTAQIGDGAITNAKIGKLAVGTAQIANAAITDAQVGNVSANKLTAGTIDFNTITGKNINASNITTGTLNTARLNVGQLSALSANLGDVTTGSLKGVDIVAKTFSTPNGSFTTDKNGSVVASNLTVRGVTNLVYNASLLGGNGSSIPGWGIYNKGYCALNMIHDGVPSIGWNNTVGDSVWAIFAQSKLVPLNGVTGQPFSASVWFLEYGSDASLQYQFTLAFFDSNGTRIDGAYVGQTWNGIGSKQDWRYVAINNAVAPSNAVSVGLQYWAYNGTGNAYFSSPMLTQTAQSTGYMPDTGNVVSAGEIDGSVINGSTINGTNINATTFHADYSVADSLRYFQPINGTGELNISHGYIQSTANLNYYNKVMSGMADSWGYWASSVTFVPDDKLTISNTAESTLTPAFLKLDIFNQAKTSVVSRAYVDGTGLYINDGQSESVSSMLSDFELLSSGMAYLMGGVQINKHKSFTFGNLEMNGYHSIAMLDGKAINFLDKTGTGARPIEVKAKTFTKSSQLSIKHDITPLTADESSRLLNSIDVEKFRYSQDNATYKYQYGAVIDDINELGNKQYSLPAELLSEDGTGINLDSMTGILIKTVQDQNKKIGELSMRLTRLETA